MGEYILPGKADTQHAMIATGIEEIEGDQCIQLKNSYRDDPTQEGITSNKLF